MDNFHKCQCPWLIDKHCDESPYNEFEGRSYCVLHYPSMDKQEAFERMLKRRFNKNDQQYLNFQGVWFPSSISFASRQFDSLADFSAARFNADVDFTNSRFADVSFFSAEFSGNAHFQGSGFRRKANFRAAVFRHNASFYASTFDRAIFTKAQFHGFVEFRAVDFGSKVSFGGANFGEHADFDSHIILAGEDTVQKEHRTIFKEAYFGSAIFKSASFRHACFSENANFNHATFQTDANFYIAEFRTAVFERAQLSSANFEGAFFIEDCSFANCEFSGASDFGTARFRGADFSEATFNDSVDFSQSRFETALSELEQEDRLGQCFQLDDRANGETGPVKISFDRATFREGLIFRGNNLFQHRCVLTFDDALFEKPERVKFQAVSLPPHSFINVDPRQFHFADVRWGFIDKRATLRDARAALAKHDRSYSAPMLELAYRQLAVNAEENNRYEEAANLRYLAMEVARSMRWRRVDWLRLSWWYWLLSGYGERVRRAFAALIIIWLSFALIYWAWADTSWWQTKQQRTGVVQKTEVASSTQLNFPEALLYSGSVMALQKPEPLPANKRAKLFVLFETVLGPLQAALLALAIRRKFMR